MVDREQNLGGRKAEETGGIPRPRQRQGQRESGPQPRRVLTDQELLTFLPAGNYRFERLPLEVTGVGIEEVGIRNTRERIEAYQLGSDGQQKALRGVLTGYRGIFGRGRRDQEVIRMDIVGILTGEEMSTEIVTAMPKLDVYRLAQAVARKRIPISTSVDTRTGETIGLSSATPAGLLADIRHLQEALGLFSSRSQRTLRRARAVAEHLKSNFKSERPSNQPGRAKVKGQ